MQQIINFFIRNKVFLLFLLLFSISLFLTFQSHSYHKSKFINSANFLTGGVYESVNNIGQYFNLKEENEKSTPANMQLKHHAVSPTKAIIRPARFGSSSFVTAINLLAARLNPIPAIVANKPTVF